MGLRALSVGVLVVALAIAVGQHQGLIQSEQLQGVLQRPAVARAVDRLRSLPLVQRLYGPAPGCSCGVSAGWVPRWMAAGGLCRAGGCKRPCRRALAAVGGRVAAATTGGTAQLAPTPHAAHACLPACPLLQNVTDAASEQAACNLAGNVTDCCECALAARRHATPPSRRSPAGSGSPKPALPSQPRCLLPPPCAHPIPRICTAPARLPLPPCACLSASHPPCPHPPSHTPCRLHLCGCGACEPR